MVACRYGISLFVFNSTNPLVRCVHLWAIELNTRTEISHLRAPMYYSLFIALWFFIYRAIIYQLSRDNFHLSRDVLILSHNEKKMWHVLHEPSYKQDLKSRIKNSSWQKNLLPSLGLHFATFLQGRNCWEMDRWRYVIQD